MKYYRLVLLIMQDKLCFILFPFLLPRSQFK